MASRFGFNTLTSSFFVLRISLFNNVNVKLKTEKNSETEDTKPLALIKFWNTEGKKGGRNEGWRSRWKPPSLEI